MVPPAEQILNDTVWRGVKWNSLIQWTNCDWVFGECHRLFFFVGSAKLKITKVKSLKYLEIVFSFFPFFFFNLYRFFRSFLPQNIFFASLQNWSYQPYFVLYGSSFYNYCNKTIQQSRQLGNHNCSCHMKLFEKSLQKTNG